MDFTQDVGAFSRTFVTDLNDEINDLNSYEMNQELGQHRFAMSHQSNNGLNWQIDNQFHNETYNEIYNEINHQMNHPMNHQINHQIHNEIHNEMNQVNQLDQNAVNEQTMNQPTYESTLNQHSNYFADNFIPTGWELDVYNSEIDDTESVQSDELNKYFFTNRFINEDDFEEDTNWIVDRNGIQTSNEEIDGLNMDLANLDDTYLSADELANQSNSINRTTNDQRPNDDKLTGLELVPYVSDDEIGKNDECSTGCIKNEIDYDCSYLKENFFVSDADQMDNERDDVLESYKNEFQMNFPKLFKSKKKKSKKVNLRHLLDGDHSTNVNIRTRKERPTSDHQLNEDESRSSETINLDLPSDHFTCLPDCLFNN